MGVLINKVKVDVLISRSMVYYNEYYESPRKTGMKSVRFRPLNDKVQPVGADNEER